MIKNKFKIGERVANLKTGNLIQGVVVGCVVNTLFLQNKNPALYATWTSYYSDWQEKCIYFVKLDKSAPNCSLTEFIKQRPSNVSEMDAVVKYQECKKHDFMSYPEDDLKKV